MLLCRECDRPIASMHNCVTMTEREQDTVFVNPGGASHGLTCVSAVEQKRLLYVGQPSTQFSWFPGFAWTIMVCRHCGVHMGWRFSRPERGAGGCVLGPCARVVPGGHVRTARLR